MNRSGRILGFALALGVAVTAPAYAEKKPVELVEATSEIPHDQLLDVGIVILDPGLPEDDENALEEQAVFAEARRSEARFIPFHLKGVLESSGQWGAVRVVPPSADNVDVRIEGTILESNGRKMALAIRAFDSTGRKWTDRNYKGVADPRAFDDDGKVVEVGDPYESVYNRIANDLVKAREKLEPGDLHGVRAVTRMRFAIGIAPDIFDDYMSRSKKGRWQIERLPADGDPMMSRIDMIRERDYLFVDTLNEFYAELYARMGQPYDDWREFSYEERMAIRAIRREATTQKIIGGLLLLGAAFADGGSSAARVARDAAAVGGALALQKGISTGQEAKIHKAAIRELAGSFDAEISPVLVEIEGKTLRLQGSAETQYAEWRGLLSRIFATETGLTADPNAEPDATAASAEL
jgi:hypothetical protein